MEVKKSIFLSSRIIDNRLTIKPQFLPWTVHFLETSLKAINKDLEVLHH